MTAQFNEYIDGFKHLALQEGWNTLVEAIKKDSTWSVQSCTIKCFMHDKNQKRTLNQRNNQKRKIKQLKTNCGCRYAIKLSHKNDKNNAEMNITKLFHQKISTITKEITDLRQNSLTKLKTG